MRVLPAVESEGEHRVRADIARLELGDDHATALGKREHGSLVLVRPLLQLPVLRGS